MEFINNKQMTNEERIKRFLNESVSVTMSTRELIIILTAVGGLDNNGCIASLTNYQFASDDVFSPRMLGIENDNDMSNTSPIFRLYNDLEKMMNTLLLDKGFSPLCD